MSGSVLVGIHHVDSYSPTAGDLVTVQVSDGAWLVTGKVA